MESIESSSSQTALKRQKSDIALTTPKYKFDREAVEFSVKGPISITLDDEQVIHPGASVLDILFSTPSEIGEVLFRNYYTAWLSVLVRYESQTSADSKYKDKNKDASWPQVPRKVVAPSTMLGYRESGKQEFLSISLTEILKNKDVTWTLAIPRKVLMPNPHREIGSQDCFSVSVTESSVPWKNVVAMRLVLRQASPLWGVFHIEELNVYTDMPRLSAPKSVTHMPHLHDIYYDHLQRLRYQTKIAMIWNPFPKPEPKKSPPKPESSPKKDTKKMTAGPVCGYEITKLPSS